MITFWFQMKRVCRVLISIIKDDESRGLTWITLFLLFVGTMFYSKAEHFSHLDAFYFSFTTLTTIGYGDFYPVTVVGKIFTISYALIGLGVMGSFLAVVVKHFLKGKSQHKKKK